MEDFAKVLDGLAAVLWPALVIIILVWLRPHLLTTVQALSDRLRAGASLKFGNFFEIKGVEITKFDGVLKDSKIYSAEEVTQREFDSRHKLYGERRNIFLVHTAVPTGDREENTQLPIYHVSVYLIAHKEFGMLNDIKEVSYYFGKYWGAGPYGEKFVVRTANDNFAVRLRAYGPSLCVCTVTFHDGKQVTVDRYLDFEMASNLPPDPSPHQPFEK